MLGPGHETLNNGLVMSKNAKSVEKITVALEPDIEDQQSSEDTPPIQHPFVEESLQRHDSTFAFL